MAANDTSASHGSSPATWSAAMCPSPRCSRSTLMACQRIRCGSPGQGRSALATASGRLAVPPPGEVTRPPGLHVVSQGGCLSEYFRRVPEHRMDWLQLVPHATRQPVLRCCHDAVSSPGCPAGVQCRLSASAAARAVPGSGRLRTGAFIWSHVMGRSEPGIWKDSKRVWPISGFSRRVMARCGSDEANASRLAWSSHTEKAQNVLRATSASSA